MTGSIILTALMVLSGCKSSVTSYVREYTFSDDTSELNADVGKEKRLDSYAKDQVYLLDDSEYPVENCTAEAALLFALDDDYTVILCKNAYGSIQPGNITKIIAADCILQNYDVSLDVLIDSSIFSVDSSLWSCYFTQNDIVNMKDLLYAAVMYCANDVMIPLSIYTEGDVNYLVQVMNSYMEDLGAEDTTFINCFGTEESGQQTTIYDLYLFFRNAVNNSDLMEMLETSTYSCQYTNGESQNGIVFTNSLPYFLHGYESATGLSIVGGVCEAEETNPTQMLTIAEDEDGMRYLAFVAGCDGYADCLAQTEEILSQISN